MTTDVPFETPASPYSADELRRFDADTRAKVSLAMNALATRASEQAQHREKTSGANNTALLAHLRDELEDAARAMDELDIERATSDLLLLPRVCPHAACRRALACRGDARCLECVAVPEAVLDRVVCMLLARRVPWIRGRADEALAYDCWIAGITAAQFARSKVEGECGSAGGRPPLPGGERDGVRGRNSDAGP